MPLTKVTRNGQVTIPSELRRQIGIEEGDLIELKAVGDHLILVPKKLIDKSQTYFWTPKWQAAEREAQHDIDEGRVGEFETVDDLLADLHSSS
jgi:AbrB family looped-hinge helix DNA binding protein